MRFKTNSDQRGQADMAGQGLARFLGVFSVTLGLIELVWGGPLAHALGLQNYEWLVRVYGARELATGILIFAFKDPIFWIWFRVLGDALDLATVAFGYSRHLAPDLNFLIGFLALLGATALDIYCAIRLSRDSKTPQAPPHDYSQRSGLPGVR